MRPLSDEQQPARIEAAELRASLERMLGSAVFSGALRSSRFLRYIVEESLAGRSEGIKESVIALEVFQRGAGFDPRTDSTVRVEARNLRGRLNEYYMTVGSEEAVVIELPKGGYVPVFRSVRSTRRMRPPRARLWWGMAAAAVALLLAGGAASVALRRPLGAPSIAVLPFSDGNGGESEYVGDGFAEDLINELAALPGLKVAARASSFQFRKQPRDLRAAGKKLDVGTVIEGTAQLEGGRLRVRLRLVATDSGAVVWAGGFERDVADAQTIAADIRQAVAAQLGLSAGAGARAQRAPPENARAAYWRGRYALSRSQDRAAAMRHYRDAIALDPGFADAWAALSLNEAIMAFHWEGDANQLASQARASARRAIALKETVHEAHLALALLGYSYDRDWAASRREFRRVFEISPSWAYAHRSYALALMSRGAFDEALLALERARRLDPLSLVSTNEHATVLLCARRYDEAIAAARAHLALKPDFHYARMVIAVALAGQRKYATAASEFEHIAQHLGRSSDVLGRWGNALALAGRGNEARALLSEIQRKEMPPHSSDVHLAMIHAGLGEKEEAVARLTWAAAAHTTDVVFVSVDPVFDSLRTEPGYRSLCATMGLL